MARVAPSGLDTAGQAWGDTGQPRALPRLDHSAPSASSGPELLERGCLPYTNCCVAVPEDRYCVVEKFGKFETVLQPGLSFAGLDLLGWCRRLRSISSRVSQTDCVVYTKTKDNVFVTLHVAVQKSVLPETVQAAVYRLSNVEAQIDSYVSDVVRSQIPLLTLDEAFEKKDCISNDIQLRLKKEMAENGYQIHRALVVDLSPDQDVVDSMNEINKQRRLRDASIMAAEAAQIRIVKAAEAAATASQLQGEGIARQRSAIIHGLQDSITYGLDETLSVEAVKHLVLTTQYYHTLQDIAASNHSSTVFMTHDAGEAARVMAQIQQSVLHAAAAAPGQVRM